MFYLVYYLILGGCARRSIEAPIQPLSSEEIKESIARLEELSFEFEIKFEKIGTKGSFKGRVVKGDAHVDGVWEFAGKSEQINLIGLGEKEYRLEKGEYKECTRTNLSNPSATIKLVCSTELGEYRFKQEEGSEIIYEFNPNLLFLDPSLYESQDSKGMIWVDKRTGFVKKILATAPNVRWECEIKNIGKEYEIVHPLAKEEKIEVEVGEVTLSLLEKVAQILTQRFELYGFRNVKHKLLVRKPQNKIALFFTTATKPTESLIDTLIGLGDVELYSARYASEDELKESYPVGGDPTNRVVLKEKLQTNLVATDFEELSDGTNLITLTFDKDLPEEGVAVVVDTAVIGFVPEVWGKTLKIEGSLAMWVKIKLRLPCKVIFVKESRSQIKSAPTGLHKRR